MQFVFQNHSTSRFILSALRASQKATSDLDPTKLIANDTTMAPKSILPWFRPLSKPIVPPLLRHYHSYDHPPPPGPFSPTETSILSASIPHIPLHGFTHTTLSLGAKDAGYIDASTNLFPTSAFSLVHYHLYTKRLALGNRTHIISPPLNEGQKSLGVGGKVKALTWERLMENREVIHRWQEVCLSSPISSR